MRSHDERRGTVTVRPTVFVAPPLSLNVSDRCAVPPDAPFGTRSAIVLVPAPSDATRLTATVRPERVSRAVTATVSPAFTVTRAMRRPTDVRRKLTDESAASTLDVVVVVAGSPLSPITNVPV